MGVYDFVSNLLARFFNVFHKFFQIYTILSIFRVRAVVKRISRRFPDASRPEIVVFQDAGRSEIVSGR